VCARRRAFGRGSADSTSSSHADQSSTSTARKTASRTGKDRTTSDFDNPTWRLSSRRLYLGWRWLVQHRPCDIEDGGLALLLLLGRSGALEPVATVAPR